MIMELQEFHFDISYIQGCRNEAADLLSRINTLNNINFGIQYQGVMNDVNKKHFVMRKVGDSYYQCWVVPYHKRKQVMSLFHTNFHFCINNTYNEMKKFF